MTKAKYLGIWMDHSIAYLMEFSNNLIETQTIKKKFAIQEKEFSLSKSENLMHNKEQHQQGEYYKELGKSIIKYEEVILFGPTVAKSELLNILRKNHLFEKVKIAVQNADKMTENQQHAFLNDYFSKH